MSVCPRTSSKPCWPAPPNRARRALADVGLDGPEAAIDIHDLRTLLDSLRIARRTAWQTIVRLLTTGLLLALIAGIAVKLKLFG